MRIDSYIAVILEAELSEFLIANARLNLPNQPAYIVDYTHSNVTNRHWHVSGVIWEIFIILP